MSRTKYSAAIESIKKSIAAKELVKVVLSRAQVKQGTWNVLDVFQKVNKSHKSAFVYLLGLPNGDKWVAATPEVLFERKGHAYTTMALAGTKQHGQDWTEKERDEQQIVTDFIEQSLQGIGATNINITQPYDAVAGALIHLRSDISFTFDGQEQEVLSVLHPTPAVCGVPKAAALQKIEELEPHDRSFYSGYIGMSGESESHFFVNLRCAQFGPGAVTLFAGGGITLDSNVVHEWNETENKLKTIASFL